MPTFSSRLPHSRVPRVGSITRGTRRRDELIHNKRKKKQGWNRGWEVEKFEKKQRWGGWEKEKRLAGVVEETVTVEKKQRWGY
ncbi:hypothetical protein NDU88_003411 [Pleurodeles waltl]|uniref:Uncharacterized protein n=1 Tax=Pleurodeles waltl TaxID=8319 RepID=A0AAV7TQJ8_PLEWA|nr:hypothetical protein NDU88_003411 [Pleurodeles waltl]